MNDSVWVMYNKRLIEAMAENNFDVLSVIYYEMADGIEKSGIDGAYLREQGYKSKLHATQTALDNHLIEVVEISVYADGCGLCNEQQGKLLSAEDARLLNPIPVKECASKQGCRCTYLPVLA